MIRDGNGSVLAAAVQQIKKKSSRTEICWIIADIQNKMEVDNMTVIRHIPRDCNVVAHALVKIAVVI